MVTSNHSSGSILMTFILIKKKNISSNYPGRYIRLPVSTFSLMPATLKTRNCILKRFCFEKNVRTYSLEAMCCYKRIRGSSFKSFVLQIHHPLWIMWFQSDFAVPGGEELTLQALTPKFRLDMRLVFTR